MSSNSLEKAIAERGASWLPGDNPIARLSDADFGRMLGAAPPAEAGTQLLAAARDPSTAPPVLMPRSVDWRDHEGVNRLTPIRTQGTCGSCVAFAIAAAMESAILIASNGADAVDLSESDLFFCGGGTCADGIIIEKALERAKKSGVGLESDFPYEARDLDCVTVAPAYRIGSWQMLRSSMQRKQALVEDGPVIGQMQVFDDLRRYASGVYEYVEGPLRGLHAVCVVGYDDGDGCWIVKNSWSDRHGEDGFLRIKYGQCCLDDFFPFYGISVAKA